MNSKNILFIPNWSKENPYQNLLMSSIQQQGHNVYLTDYPKSPLPLTKISLNHPAAAIIHLHWIAPYIQQIIWTKSPTKRILKLVLIRIDFLIAKLLRKRIVWTVHNLISHESTDKEFEKSMRNIFYKYSNEVIFHSLRNESIFNKVISPKLKNKNHIIPHGNYINVYPKNATNFQAKAPINTITLLFFGQIRAYKGIVDFANKFSEIENPDLILKIIGKELDKDSGQNIRLLCDKNQSIQYLPSYVPDSSVYGYYDQADIAVIPFERTLTSGSVILAMSMGKPILLPSHAESIGLPKDAGIIYYDDNNIINTLNNLPDKHKLKEMGELNFKIAQTWSWEEIGRKTIDVYLQRNI